MPDNKNPPENHQPQKPEDEEEKISRVGVEAIECPHPDCHRMALSLSTHCWEHTEDKEAYRRKIQEWHWAGKSMERFILAFADLSGLEFYGADLSKARLWGVNLSCAHLDGATLSESRLQGAYLAEAILDGAKLTEAKLRGTELPGARLELANLYKADLSRANLSGAKLDGANLSGAFLNGANLSGALLVEADLSKAVLRETDLSGVDLTGSNLSEALFIETVLINAYLNWAKLTNVISLTKSNFSEKITLEEKKDAEHYKGSYMTVKNHFIQSGQYDDASWAAFRERTLERIAWYKETKLEELKDLFSWNNWKTAFRWSRSMLMNLLCGYGEKPWKAVASSVIIVIGFFLFYLFKECIKANPPEALRWWDYLYFSIVTFTTLGYGDIRPLAAPWARLVASGEAFIGAFMIALFVWTLARRYVAR